MFRRTFTWRKNLMRCFENHNAVQYAVQIKTFHLGGICSQVGFTRPISTSFKCLTTSKDLSLVSRIEKNVKPYGYLELQNIDLDLVIKPASPDAFPNMDRAICSFFTNSSVASPEFTCLDDMLTIKTQQSYKTGEHKCHIEVPIKYEVDVSNVMGENSVSVESLETVSARVTTCSGNITSKNLKGNHICLLSQSGKISCTGSSQGRIILQSGSGDINGKKFQGPSLKVTTNSGNIYAQSIYSDTSNFFSVSGDIHLKNLHMKSHVKITGTGNLTVSGMDGSLHALLGSGSHEIQISQLKENSYVQVINGTLVLKVPNPCSFGIRITAQSIDVTERILETGCLKQNSEGFKCFEYRPSENALLIQIDAHKSKVHLLNEDWFSSLKLGFSDN